MEETSSHKVRYSLLLYIGLALVAFFPCLVMNQAYFANDLLNYYAHSRFILQQQLAHGHFPLWNPYYLGGQPFFADPNTMACYPLNYLTLLFPIPYGLGVFFFLHMVLAAFGMHLWLRSLRIHETACRIGALVFALSGTFWWEMIHPPILAVYAWLPWLMLCLERLSQRLSLGWAFLSGLCFAVIFCCGNFQSTTIALYSALAYFFFRILFKEETRAPGAPTPFPWKRLLAVLFFVIWGSLPLFTHLIPANEFSEYTNRRDPAQTYEKFNAQFSLTPASTYEFILPNLGVPDGQTIEYAIQQITDNVNISNDFEGAFGYMGVWIPVLFFLAFRRKERKFLWFLCGVGALSIMTAWGRWVPLHQMLCVILPGVNLSRAPFRFMQAYILFGTVLAAYGYQMLERLFQEKTGRNTWVLVAGVYALVLFILCALKPAQTWHEMLGLLLGAAGLALWGFTDSWKKMGAWFFQAALILPLLLCGWGDFSTGPVSNFDYGNNFPLITELKANAQGCRYYFDNSVTYPVRMNGRDYQWLFPQDMPMDFGVRDCAGYNPIFLKRPSELKKLPEKTYLNLMAVKGLIFGKDVGNSPVFNKKMSGAYYDYEPVHPGNYINAPYLFQVVTDPQQDLQIMSNPDFDPSAQAILTAPPSPHVLSHLPGKKADLQYDVLRDEMDDQLFKVRLDLNSLVTFSEIAFPGWQAFLDGKPADLMTSNHVFRTLFIPAGEHQVEFRFIPWWFKPLLILLAVWCFSAVLLGIFLWTRRETKTLDPLPAH